MHWQDFAIETAFKMTSVCVYCMCFSISYFISLCLYLRRFHHSLTGNNRWIRERSHESYAKNYSVVFPFDEPLASRNMRKDPFHQVLPFSCISLSPYQPLTQDIFVLLSIIIIYNFLYMHVH